MHFDFVSYMNALSFKRMFSVSTWCI